MGDGDGEKGNSLVSWFSSSCLGTYPPTLGTLYIDGRRASTLGYVGR